MGPNFGAKISLIIISEFQLWFIPLIQDQFQDSPLSVLRCHEAERRGGNGGGPRPNRIEGVKLNIPPFKGKSNPEAYLEWELKIEHIFSCNTYEEAQKLKLAAAEFSDYALVWWNKLQRERARNEEPLVETWVEMKRIMRKRYVPTSYTRDLKFKLQKLSQGSKGVEEYYKEMKVLMIQAKIK